MKYSKSTELAIHGLWMLANRRPGLMLISEMARAQNVSQSYLAKVFQKLARRGLARSIRGKRGGFTLARSPESITLGDVVRVIETREPLYECMDASRGCRGRAHCALRNAFGQAEQSMYRVLEKTTLADLMYPNDRDARAAWLT